MRDDLEKYLISLEKPLDFAAKNNFSNLEKVSELGEDVRKISTKFLAGNFPGPVKSRITSLRNSFSGFSELARPDKIRRVSSALALIRKMKNSLGSFSEPNTPPHSPPPQSGPERRHEGFLQEIADIPGVGRKAEEL
ncbi:MAG: hypothetical protein OXF23_06965, partial [Candidatus Dadabacteria bacterium]|nr:hypothetical protein [Candidatus Dadabacteria bacterium]